MRRALGCWLAAVCASAWLHAQRDLASTAAVQLEPGWSATSAMLVDVDGDGHDDLLVVANQNDTDYRRELRVHRGRVPFGYTELADTRLALPYDVVAVAVGDVSPAPGSEVLLFGTHRAVTWRPLAPREEAFSELLGGEGLWQIPDPKTVLSWQSGVQDLDGDGLVDVLLPLSNGYRVAFQRRDGESAVFEKGPDLVVPRDAGPSLSGLRNAGAGGMKVEIEVGDGPPGWLRGPFLSVDDRVPVPWAADFDGDGDRDLLALTQNHLQVWLQNPPRRFAAAPSLRIELPVVGDLKRRLDVTFGAHVADMNRDGRADCVLLAGDYRTDDVRTQVLVYVQHPERAGEPPLFGKKGIPEQLLVLSGFAGGTQLTDVDGDEAPDLVVGSLRTDLMDSIGAAMSERLEAELYVYLNRGGSVSRRPDLVHSVVLQAGELIGGANSLMARFFGDVTGDRVSDLVLRKDRTHVQVLMVRKSGGALDVVDEPVWQRTVHEDTNVIALPPGSGPPELLLVEPSQVVHVRFR